TVKLELRVMPRGPRPEALVQLDGLRIPAMALVVRSPMAEIDPAHECHVLVGSAGVANQHELLVMRARPADTFIEQGLAASRVDHLGEPSVLLFAELPLVRMRAPDETANRHARSGEVGQ